MPSVDCDTYDIPGYAVSDYRQYDTHEGVPYIESAAAYDEETAGSTCSSSTSTGSKIPHWRLDIRGFEDYDFVEQIQLYTDDIDAANSHEDPNVIVPSINSGAKFEDGKVSTVTKKLSWNVFRFKKQ